MMVIVPAKTTYSCISSEKETPKQCLAVSGVNLRAPQEHIIRKDTCIQQSWGLHGMDVLGLCSHHWWHKLLAKMYRKKIRLGHYHCPWLNVLSTLSSHAHFQLWNASAQDDSPFEQGLKLLRPFTWCEIFQNKENSSWDKMTVMYPYYHRSKGHEE